MIGVIADDLTGAAELGALAWRFGLRAEVRLNGTPNPGMEVVCVDTHSRSCAPTEAAQRAKAATAMFRTSQARWIYKKTDSILRGQVVPEIEAIMQDLRLARCILVPANPSLGRVIQDGQYFIHAKPIHQTEFARDPQHPRLSPRVLDLLTSRGAMPVGISKPGSVLPEHGIAVGEAVTVADLDQWASQRNESTLYAGGAEFFGALLRATGHTEHPSQSMPGPNPGAELFVCGTTSQSSLQFISAAQANGIPVLFLPPEVARQGMLDPQTLERLADPAAKRLESNRKLILSIRLPLVTDRVIANRLAETLVELAKTILDRTKVTHIFAEGGATARVLIEKMGWSELRVAEEVALGTVTLLAPGEGQTRVTIKPGSYPWPDRIRIPFTQATIDAQKP